MNITIVGNRWLDTTPVSRILTRCSQDTAAIDDRVSLLVMSFGLFAGRILVTAVTALLMAGWQMAVPTMATVVSGLLLGQIYMTAQLPVKRLTSNAKSPIIAQIQTALIGIGL